MNRSLLRAVPMLVVMGAVFLLSHQPGDTFSDVVFFPFADKLVHMVIYMVMAATVWYAHIIEGRWPTAVMVVAVCCLYGCFDEFHQSFVPGRYPDFFDIIADFFGSFLFCLFWYGTRAGKKG